MPQAEECGPKFDPQLGPQLDPKFDPWFGGCEAVRDPSGSKQFGVDHLIALMPGMDCCVVQLEARS